MKPETKLFHLMSREPTDEIWQAAIQLSEFIEPDYEQVLEATLTALARANHDDSIAALSTCLLEHLLEHDFAGFDIIEERISQGDDKLLYALSLCSKFGSAQEEANASRWQALLDKHQNRLKRWREPAKEAIGVRN